MHDGEAGANGLHGQGPGRAGSSATATAGRGPSSSSANAGPILETIVSPFHCLYQDALEFHTQSQLRLARSEGEASRLARAALMLYLASRRGPGAPGGRRAGPARAGRPCSPTRRRPCRCRRSGGCCRRLAEGPSRGRSTPGAPLAAVRRAAGLAAVVGLSRPAGAAAGLLPRPAARRAVRAAGAAPGPAGPGPSPGRPWLPPDRVAPRPLRACGPGTSTRPAACWTPPSPRWTDGPAAP